MRGAFNLLVLPNSMLTQIFLGKRYVLSGEIALKDNHYYYLTVQKSKIAVGFVLYTFFYVY